MANAGRLLILISLLGAYYAGALPATPQENNEQKARQLWELAITAKGGRERLQRVDNLLISSHAARPLDRPGFEGLGTHHEELYVFPEKFWWWRDDRPSKFGLSAEVFDGATHWLVKEDDPESPRRLGLTTNEKEFSVRAQVFFLMETPWVKPVPVKARTEWLGLKRVDVVHTLANGYKVIFYLDRKTHLPVKASILSLNADENDEEMVDLFAVFFDDYREVQGLQMPHKVGWGSSPRHLYSFRMNVDYDEAIFAGPPKLEAGPEAWRRKASQ